MKTILLCPKEHTLCILEYLQSLNTSIAYVSFLLVTPTTLAESTRYNICKHYPTESSQTT